MQSFRTASLSVRDKPYTMSPEQIADTSYVPEKGELVNYTDEQNTLHTVIGDGTSNIRDCQELPFPVAVVEIRHMQGEEAKLMEARGATGIKHKVFLHKSIVDSAFQKRFKERKQRRKIRVSQRTTENTTESEAPPPSEEETKPLV